MVQLTKIGQIQADNDTAAAAKLRKEWVEAVTTLAKQVSEWACRQDGWQILPQPKKKITEDTVGAYSVPVVWIKTNHGRVILEPRARNVRGSDGIVDLSAYPTMYRVRLLYNESDQTWVARTDSGLNWPHPWSEATFIELANGLMDA